MSWLDTLEDIRTRDFSKVPEAERDKAARDVVNMCSYACAVVSISPIPFSDALLMLPIQSGMVMTVGHIYGRKVTTASAKDLILELGATFGVSFLARQGIKAILPVFGALLTVPAAFAANWAIGRVAMEYFKNPDASDEYLREVFKRAKEEGSSMFSKDAFDRFRKRNEDSIRAVADESQAEASDDEEAAAEEGDEGEEEAARPAPRKKAAPAKKAVEKKPLGKRPLGKKPSAKKAPAKKPARKAQEAEGDSDEEEGGALSLRALVEEELPRRLSENNALANRIKAIVHLDISGDEGGQWTLDFNKPGRWVSPGFKGAPRMTVRCKDADFLKIVTGQKNAQAAVLSGALKFDPLDLELAGQIGQLFA